MKRGGAGGGESRSITPDAQLANTPAPPFDLEGVGYNAGMCDVRNADADARFRENLQRLLAEKGLLPAELSRRSGVHKMTLSRIIRGMHGTSWEDVCAIADALGVKTEAFREPTRAEKASA